MKETLPKVKSRTLEMRIENSYIKVGNTSKVKRIIR